MRATVTNSKIVSDYKRLKTNESGNIAFMTAVAMIPMVLMMGATVDFQKSSNTQTSLQSALDSAALFAASLSDTTSTALTNKAKPFFDANYKADGGTGTPTFAIINSGSSVTATSTVNSSNAFMKIVGIPTTVVGAKSIVEKSGINLEVSLVLDNTGSMGSINSKTGNSAIFDLKAAATKFVNQVMPTVQGSYYTKIAAIPYNNSVNLGSSTLADRARGSVISGGTNTNLTPGYQYIANPSNTGIVPGYQNYSFKSVASYIDTKRSNGQWRNCPGNDHDLNGYCLTTAAITNCVSERTGTAAATDDAVSAYPVGRKYVSGGFNDCSVTPMVPLTTSASDLTTTIGNMSANNWTAGQVGLAWGWYTLSPNIGLFSGTSAPAGYDKLTTTDLTQKVKKIMILMTDGEYNTAYVDGTISNVTSYTSYGSDWNTNPNAPTNGNVYTQSKNVCAAIKASGVEVYVITFQLVKSLSWRVGLVNDCATDAGHIIDADSTSLDDAFSTIANQIQAMRIAG